LTPPSKKQTTTTSGRGPKWAWRQDELIGGNSPEADHSKTLQCSMRLADHGTLSFNNNMSTVAVFLDIEKAFDTTWHSGLPYKLSEL
jgi:hypothetical protein